MVTSAQGTSNRLMGRALLASLAFHAFVIALIPALAWMPTSGATVETITFTRVAHIEIDRRPRHPQPRAVARFAGPPSSFRRPAGSNSSGPPGTQLPLRRRP